MTELNPLGEYSTVGEALAANIEQSADAMGAFSARSRDVVPASAAPDPVTNALRFQAWIDEHPDFSVVNIPNWDIPLGAGINAGGRIVRGQGPASKLNFSGLGATEDGLTFTGSTLADRAGGSAEYLTVAMNNTGRDGIRWNGGRRCTAYHVKVISPARDGYHFEQDISGRWFENAGLDFCEVRQGAGRYGVCVALADFGPDDMQFFNKCYFANSKVFGAQFADLALLLEDSDGAGQDTKIGGGLTLMNFHGQFEGTGNDRIGGVFVKRGPASGSQVDAFITYGSTFEHNAGNAVENGALVVEDNSLISTNQPIGEFIESYTLLTGFGEFWDLNAPAPVDNTHHMIRPRKGVFTNSAMKQFGTGRNNTRYLNNGETSVLFDASDRRSAWKVTVRRASDSATSNSAYVISDVVGGDVPVIVDPTSDVGGLALGVSGTNITVTNAVGFGIPVTWSVIPLI